MSHDVHDNHAAARRRAFTALELSLSLGLGAIVALCAVSLTSATGRIWQQQQEGGIGINTGQRTESYLERALRQAQNVGYFSTGAGTDPATLLLWDNDDHPDAGSDRRIQVGELTLFEFDEENGQLMLVTPIPWDSMTESQKEQAAAVLTQEQLELPSAAETFAASDWVTRKVIAGGAAEDVTNAWWSVDRSADRPVVRFRIDMTCDGQPVSSYGTVTLRIRAESDDWTEEALKRSPVEEDTGDDGGDDGDGGGGLLDIVLDLFP